MRRDERSQAVTAMRETRTHSTWLPPPDDRAPDTLAACAFALACVPLYGVLAWSAAARTAGGAPAFGPVVREALALAALVPLALSLVQRLPARGPLTWVAHAAAGVAVGVAVVAFSDLAVPAVRAWPRLVGLAGVYALAVLVLGAYRALRGPDPPRVQQLALDLVRAPAPGETHRERFVVARRGAEIVVDARDVTWIQAAGRAVILHAGGESHRLREPMAAVEQSLDPRTFVRVHRSGIVNLDRIRAIHPSGFGDYRIVMRDGTVVNYSRVYRGRLEALMG
jgi:DNA-binding LytR/AlgR family response regulator